jgi:hypothetical protein
MTIIYFYPFESQPYNGSGSATVYNYYDTSNTNTQLISTSPENQNADSFIVTYDECLVLLTGSNYPTSGAVDRINIYTVSGSLLATYPIENASIIYPPTASLIPEGIPIEETSFGLNWSLITSTLITSSLNQLAVYSASSPITYSVYQATSSAAGNTALEYATTYSLHVSGGGTFYTTSLKLEDEYFGNTLVYLTASNSNITYSLSESYSGRSSNYKLTTTAESWSGILLEYESSSSIEVVDSGSVEEWNKLLGIEAIAVYLTGSNVNLVGGMLTNTGSLIISSSVSSSIVAGGLRKLTTYGVTDLEYLTISSGSNTGSLVAFPLVPGNSMTAVRINYQKITGSAIDPTLYGNPVEIDCSNNQLSGSLPLFNTQSSVLYTYNCENNAIAGGLPDLSVLGNLNAFNCSSNQITGSIKLPSNISTFKSNNNLLSDYVSGSLLFELTYFDGANNQFSQSAIDGIVTDLYNAGALNGYLDLRGSNNATASISSSLKAITMETDRGWEIYLPGEGTTLATQYSNNLGGYPILPGISDGLTSSYFYIANDTLSINYIYYSGSQLPSSYQSSFRVPTSHSYEIGLSGWYYVSSSYTLNYTASLIIDAVSASITTPIYSGVGVSAALSASFTGSNNTTYVITASIEYGGNYYDELLKYAEAVGY